MRCTSPCKGASLRVGYESARVGCGASGMAVSGAVWVVLVHPSQGRSLGDSIPVLWLIRRGSLGYQVDCDASKDGGEGHDQPCP